MTEPNTEDFKACESQFLVYRHFFFQSWWGDFFIISSDFIIDKCMPYW